MRRINKLNNVGRFISLRSGSGSQADFSRLNVIYAPNGSGKTTICDAFRSLGTKKTEFLVGRKRLSSTGAVEVEVLFKGTPTVRAWLAGNQWQVEPMNGAIPKFFVYDDRFVADNVLIGHSVLVEQRRNIYGLVLGDRARTLKGAVEVAEGSLSEASEELAKARTALNALVPSGWKGDDFRALSDDPILNERIVAAEAALDAGRKAKQNAEAIRQRKPLAVIVVPEMPGAIQKILCTTLEDAAIQAEAKIQQHLRRCTSGLRMEWIGEGHRAQRGTSCPHCGRDMDGLEILKAYKSFFSGELRAQQVAQDGLQQAIDSQFGVVAQQRVEQMLTSHFVERDWWRDAAGVTLDFPTCPAIEEIRGAMSGVHSSVSEAIRRKRSQPALAITLDDGARLSLDRWGSVSESLSRYLSSLDALNAVIAKHQGSVSAIDLVVLEREHSTLLARKLRHEPATVEAIRVFDAAIAKRGAAEKSKAEANAALRQQSEQVLREYGERINALLVSFGVGFRIVPVGVNFHGGPPAGDIAIEILGNRRSCSRRP